MKAENDAGRHERIRLGVSSCLLGMKVRFDGGHKHDRLLTEVWGCWFEWVPVCPEMEIGLGTPRESLRLEQRGGRIQLVAPRSGSDHTERMHAWSKKRLAGLEHENFCGYVLKKDSPSCGMERVRVYDSNGVPERAGRGLFAEALARRFPHLPVEEEGRLNDPALRENFVGRVFAYHRWTNVVRQGLTRVRLYQFHERHKYQLMAHNQAGMRRLGQMLATSPRTRSAAALGSDYLEEWSAVMQRVPTRRNHTNVLQHLAGYVSDRIDTGDRAELTAMIHGYRTGLVPLVVPLTLLRHHIRRLQVPYLFDQVYLSPHPGELMLLNHI